MMLVVMMQREAMKLNVVWAASTSQGHVLIEECGTLLLPGANSVLTSQSRAKTTNDDRPYEKLQIHEQRIMNQDHEVLS